MNVSPLVSIVIPVYNVEKYIAESLMSVVSQTYKNIELILIDDGSEDNSVEIAKEILFKSGFPFKIISQSNEGVSSARNAGIKNSNGDWIVFFDSDDIMLPHAVEHLVASICDESVDMVFSGFSVVHSFEDIVYDIPDGKKRKMPAYKLQNEFLTRKSVILVAGTLFKKSVIFQKNIFFDKMPWSEDQHFIWRYLSFAENAVFLDEALYLYFRRENSIMTLPDIQKMIVSYEKICELPDYLRANKTVSDFLVQRWVLGTLNSTAKTTDYESFEKLFYALDGKNTLKKMLNFPSFKVKALSALGIISKKMMFCSVKLRYKGWR